MIFKVGYHSKSRSKHSVNGKRIWQYVPFFSAYLTELRDLINSRKANIIPCLRRRLTSLPCHSLGKSPKSKRLESSKTYLVFRFYLNVVNSYLCSTSLALLVKITEAFVDKVADDLRASQGNYLGTQLL